MKELARKACLEADDMDTALTLEKINKLEKRFIVGRVVSITSTTTACPRNYVPKGCAAYFVRRGCFL